MAQARIPFHVSDLPRTTEAMKFSASTSKHLLHQFAAPGSADQAKIRLCHPSPATLLTKV